MNEESLEFNKFTYNVKILPSNGDFSVSIDHTKELPKFLYKYYSLNSNSVSALRGGFLFSSHPYQLNDKYDCSSDLVDYSKCDLQYFIHKLSVEFKIYDEEFIRNKYQSDRKWELERSVSNLERDRLFKKFGVISLTENPNDILMWSYYSLNSGFALKMETNQLKKTWYGPFPINYVDSLVKIDYNKHNPIMTLLYQTNIKVNKWEHENEWRYLTFNPKGNYHPYFLAKDVRSRFEFYNKESVKQIILGYDFLNPKILYRTTEYDIIKLRNKMPNYKLVRDVLNTITTRRIPCARIVRDTRDYRLSLEEIDIKKISSNRYSVSVL